MIAIGFAPAIAGMLDRRDWIIVGLFRDVAPRVALVAREPSVSLADVAPRVALEAAGPLTVLSPLESL